MKVTVVVAAHKPYTMPDDPLYLPLHVGAEGKESFGLIGDTSGRQISAKHPTVCDLTAQGQGRAAVPCAHRGRGRPSA